MLGPLAIFLAVAPAQGAPPSEKSPGERIPLATGSTYRLYTYARSGALEIEAINRAGDWVALRQKKGEAGWYGYNLKGRGEVRSSAQKPQVASEKRADMAVVTVRCPLQEGLEHRAEYVALSNFCIVVSELRAAQPPEGASLLRLAPRFDVDLRRLFCYGLRDERGVLHTGSIQALGARPAYVGAGGWGGPGCVVRALDPRRCYLALFNPLAGPLVAVIFPEPRTLWPHARHFLQLWGNFHNYLYAGTFDRDYFNEPTLFVIYARPDGDLAAFEADLPGVLDKVRGLVRQEVLRVPRLSALEEARLRLLQAQSELAELVKKRNWLQTWKALYAFRAVEAAMARGNARGAGAILEWGRDVLGDARASEG